MTIEEVWKNAREIMAPNCRVCPVCDGRACRGEVPGMGAAGDGSSWTACVDFLKSVKLNMDTVYDYHGVDTSFDFFGLGLKYPVFAAPIGIALNTNRALTEDEYAMRIVTGCRAAEVLAFTGDGNDPMRYAGHAAGRAVNGQYVPTIKPWKPEILSQRLEEAMATRPVAVAMDIDAAGFVNMGKDIGNVGPRTVSELRRVSESIDVPFILKGVMTPQGAEKAAAAGCAGIIVSTHGGRVMASAPSTCQVLPEIRAAVGDSLKIYVDSGIRSGMDIFKALALGADACMIGRPFTIAAHGGGAEGVRLYAEKLGKELAHTMLLCSAQSLGEISRDMIRL